MFMNQCPRSIGRTLAVGLATAAALLAAPAAFAGTVSSSGNTCMQRVFMGPPPATVSGATQLNCTANDVRISKAISAINLDTGDTPGTLHHPFTLQATFQPTVTATSRYDETYFFRLDGGTSARGDGATAAGKC